MNEAKNIKRKKKRKTNKILTILLFITILLFFSAIFYINIIPVFLTIIILLVFLGINFGLMLLNFSKKKGVRIIGYFFSALLISIIIWMMSYLFNTLGFLFNVTDGDYTIKTYNVLVLKDNYNSIKELDNKVLGISETIKENTINKVKKKIKKKVNVNFKEYDDTSSLVKSIVNEEVNAIILEDNELELLKEQEDKSYELLKEIYEIEIKNDITDIKNAVNINKEPFNIYISGTDTYGKIKSSTRSDVNMVVTVNPKTEKILITWIPRDYYVSINNEGYKDKLTHAGIYGIDSSIYAVEKLLDIDINYYVKINFTSFIDIVDTLGGVTIYNEEEFTSIDGVHFKKGSLTLDGYKTLHYVRERKSLAEGDTGRGKNQIKVLKALINKALSKDILKTYNKLLKTLDNAFITNINHTTMFSFIREELKNPRDFKMDGITLKGINSYEYTYTYKNHKLYVMVPDDKSLEEVKKRINELMD